MLYTFALIVGLHKFGYKRRFCYETLLEAYSAYLTWTGDGDPPGLWIKEKPADRLNPLWLTQAKREMAK